MTKVPATHRRSRAHGIAVGQLKADIVFHIQQLKQRAFFGVIRAGRVAGRRANTAIFLFNQRLIIQRLIGGIAPVLAAHTLVQVLGKGLRQTVGQGLDHNRVIVIVLSFVLVSQLIGTYTSGNRKGANIISGTKLFGGHKVGQRG